jgi:CheY-like chemotaxis protein
MIWLIDDDPDEMFLVTRAIKRLNPNCPYRVFERHDEALQALETEQPSIIVSDLNMPGIDGISFLRAIEEIIERKQFPLPKLLLVTAAVPYDLQERTKILKHLSEVITKPDFPQDLASHLISLLPGT